MPFFGKRILTMDVFSSTKRSMIMSRVHSKNTTPELIVRSFLFKQGFRYRLHDKKLPGKPDIVLKKYRTVIEVRGCFWHRHVGCKAATTPSSNTDYWAEKFKRNTERDLRTEDEIKKLGWHLIVIWECELKKDGFLETLPDKIKERKSGA